VLIAAVWMRTMDAGILALALPVLVVPRFVGVRAWFDIAFCAVVLLAAWSNVLDLYSGIAGWDIVMHFVCTGVIAAMGYLVLVRLRMLPEPPRSLRRLPLVLTPVIGLAVSAVWEMIEWIGWRFVSSDIYVGYQDTIGDMAAGESVTITLITTPSTVGQQTNTVNVVGDKPETNTANNQATATVQVTAPFIPPPVYCVAVSKVTPKQLFVGRKTKLTIHVTQNKKAVQGIHVQIKGPKINLRTGASNSKGVITQQLKMKKAGILIFSPIASKKCNTKRVGVTNVFTPPVTG